MCWLAKLSFICTVSAIEVHLLILKKAIHIAMWGWYCVLLVHVFLSNRLIVVKKRTLLKGGTTLSENLITHFEGLVTVSIEGNKHALYEAGTDPLLSCTAWQATLTHVTLEKYPRETPRGLSEPHACCKSSQLLQIRPAVGECHNW